MSNQKKKIALKLKQGESAIVMSYDVLMHLASTCDIMASQQEDIDDSQAWRDLADEIRFQANENLFEEQEEDIW